MALRIVKSSDPIKVDRVNLCIYAPPGVGKTTLSFSAEAPLLLDFDKGVHRAANRKDSVPISSWGDVVEMTAEDLTPYMTIICDTAGRALDFLSADIIKDNPKLGRGGSLTLQGYGVLKTRFAAWMRFLNTLGKDVVLIAHMDEQKNGDEVIERLDVQGGSKGEIYKSVDAMGRIFIRNNGRVLDFSPRENAFGKNPANLEVLTIPHPTQNNHFLADVIADMKSRMNELSEEQKKAQEAVDTWADAIKDFKSANDFNQNIAQIKQAPKAAQALFNNAAKTLGLKFHAVEGAYKEAVSA